MVAFLVDTAGKCIYVRRNTRLRGSVAKARALCCVVAHEGKVVGYSESLTAAEATWEKGGCANRTSGGVVTCPLATPDYELCSILSCADAWRKARVGGLCKWCLVGKPTTTPVNFKKGAALLAQGAVAAASMIR
jgi:hypothetical protein